MTGILLIDKPADWTSHDVVAKTRGLIKERRVGHCGTLDPMATGLLVLLIGRATRAASFAQAQEKRYIAGIRLGITTDTQDITGNVLKEREVNITPTELRDALKNWRGVQSQLPPMYSAIKVDGQRLYKLARRGEEIERQPREITIHNLELLGGEGDSYTLDITCSKGTYIRALCNDIGDSLGCGAAMSSLRRCSSGALSVDDAHSMETLREASQSAELEKLILPLDRLFSHYPKAIISGEETQRVKHGAVARAGLSDGEYRVYGPDGEFLMLGKSSQENLYTIKSFFEV